MHCPRMEMVYRETQVMPRNAFVFGAFARIVLVSSIAPAAGNGRVATKNTKEGGLA